MNSSPLNQASKLQRLKSIASNPLTVLGCVIFGGYLGWAAPEFSSHLAVVGSVYIDLLKMIVLPLMVSAIIFSLQKLFRDGDSAKVFGRVALVFLVLSLLAGILSAVGTLLFKPGENITPEVRIALGRMVGADLDNSNTVMALRMIDEPPITLTLQSVMEALIPSNIFFSLANGETLKALVFAFLFGIAVGKVPYRLAEGLNHSIESIYQACQNLTRWVNLPVPIVLVCMTSSQIAKTGLEPLLTMLGFVQVFLAIALVLVLLSILILSQRSCCTFTTAFKSIHDALSLGVATNNSTTCIPAMVDGLVNRLKFSRSRVELLVPLGASLLRTGAIAYFVCATLFVASLYDRPLSSSEIFLVVVTSVMSGFASVGMAGLLTISMVGTVCNYLGLPFEAAFILFVAIDPICAMARTSITVIGACAAVSLVCDKPKPVFV